VSAGSDQKGPEAYRTISEVAADLDLPQHVLRFWETKFGQIKPMKRAGGRRFYRPQDVDLLRGIQHLLYSEGLTIRGVQKVLREQGPKHVGAIGRGEADAATPVSAPPPKLKPARFRETPVDEAQAFFPFSDEADEPPDAAPAPAQPRPAMLKPVDGEFDDEDATPTAYAKRRREVPPVSEGYETDEAPAAPRREPAAPRSQPRMRAEEPAPEPAPMVEDEPLPKGILPEDAAPTPDAESHHSGFRFLDRLKREAHPSRTVPGEGNLSREDVRDLQAALFELLECKRLLDRTR